MTACVSFFLVVLAAGSLFHSHAHASPQPPASKNDASRVESQILRNAAMLIDAPAKWNPEDTGKCPRGAGTFSIRCALEKAVEDTVTSYASPGAITECGLLAGSNWCEKSWKRDLGTNHIHIA
ncbi:MAG: hypothetical protein JO041_05955 [Acidobacteria bacterium]|nr:hypothetical protein [Acidobacteriota bacterium]